MENVLKEKNMLIGKPDGNLRSTYAINFETGEILGLSKKPVKHFNRNFFNAFGKVYSFKC